MKPDPLIRPPCCLLPAVSHGDDGSTEGAGLRDFSAPAADKKLTPPHEHTVAELAFPALRSLLAANAAARRNGGGK